jgi:Icc protein
VLRFPHSEPCLPKLRDGGLLVLLLTCAIWVFGPSAGRATEKWRFVVMGDSRGDGSGLNEAVLSELVHEVLQQKPDLVVFPGDLVYGAWVGAAPFGDELWAWTRVMQPLYDAGIGVYVCRGNHEVGDMWDAEPGELPNPTDNYAIRWLHVFGSDDCPQYKLPGNGPGGEKYMTYSVLHKNALILGLDQYGGMKYHLAHSINQDWLDEHLANNTQPHVFAFGHEPAFRTLHYDCLDAHPDQRDAFWSSLKSAGARMYFCCHDHYYDHARVDDGDGNPDNDIHQLIVATAGASLYSWTPPYSGNNSGFAIEQLYHAERHGYLLVEVDDLAVTTTWIERRDDSPPATYVPADTWHYGVSPKNPPCRTRLTADLNGDCRVDLADLALLASQWLARSEPQ